MAVAPAREVYRRRMSRAPAPTAQVRLASDADAAAIARLLQAFNDEFAVPTPGVAVLAERLAAHLATGDLVAVVAELDDAAVAFALLSPRVSVWYAGQVAILDELYVVPALRSRGIGGRLLAFVEDHLVAGGFACLEINVDGDDVDARRFYERHGYRNQEPGETEQLLYYYRELLA